MLTQSDNNKPLPLCIYVFWVTCIEIVSMFLVENEPEKMIVQRIVLSCAGIHLLAIEVIEV